MASLVSGKFNRLLSRVCNSVDNLHFSAYKSCPPSSNVLMLSLRSLCLNAQLPSVSVSQYVRSSISVCHQCRGLSTNGGTHRRPHVQEPDPKTLRQPDRPTPRNLVEGDLEHMFSDIRRDLSRNKELDEITNYYFNGKGKVLRPLMTVLMARAINVHLHDKDRLWSSQREVAKIAEMLHTASLLHDDVIDAATTRRGKASTNSIYGTRKSVMAGDFVLSVMATLLARIRNDEVVVALAQVLADLVQGEFMQLGSKENENERFAHYLKKTFKKTASLMAYSCKAVAVLAGADDALQDIAYQYGRNLGIAFQLVDDYLDIVASSNILGKQAGADLKSGMATAPVLFACEKFPELNPMIMRRFQEPGDVERAFELVHKSDGLEQTRFLAKKHCLEAVRVISSLNPSQEQKALISIVNQVEDRMVQVRETSMVTSL